MDAAITHWINSFAGQWPVLDAAMVTTTQIGVPLIVALVVAQWWSRSDRAHVRHTAIVAGLAFLFGLAINQGVILFIHRLRPYDSGVSHLLIGRSADWSFPSDHATASFAVVVAFFLERLPRRGLGLLLLATLVGFSRVFVGTHYVGDILGGIVTASIAAYLVHRFYREGTALDRFATSIL